MKRTMKTWALVAVAAMGLTACQNDFEEQVEAKDSVVVTFVADSADTRTSVDTSGDTPEFTWDQVENFYVLEQTADTFVAVNTDQFELNKGKAYITAEFEPNEGKGEYKYVTIYPEEGYVVDATTDINNATLTLPAEQEMLTPDSYGVSDLMVSEVVTTKSQPTEVQPVRFTRLAAVVQLTLKNLSAEEQIESVTFEAAGKHLAGEIVADLNNPHEFVAGSESSSSVKVVAHPDVESDIYFTVLPTTLEAGETYTVTVVTDKKIYIKDGAIPAEKSLVFESGMVTRVGVNMADVEGIDKWTLVRDASTLKEGDVVAIVAKDYDKALSTKLYSNASETSTTAKRGVADVEKKGNFLKGGEDLQKLTLMTGVADGTFSFYDEARGKFLVSTTTGSTYLINQVYCDVNTSFAITIDEATTAATITNTEGTYKGNLLRYNSNGYFVSNQNTSTVYKDVCIYRLEGTVGEVPVVAAVVTVPDSDESVVIAEEGAAVATAIDAVVFNYVGDWKITASADKDWLKLAYDAANSKVTYTAEENTGVKRDAVATITASLEGEESLTWSFNVLQKGAPIEVTIEEFITKGKDENITYKLTGKVTSVPTSKYDPFVLEDAAGNKANIKYLYNGDTQMYGSSNTLLEVGDVVTVTTVVAGTTKGTGGSSAYHSIYKGHYGLKALAGVAADYTGGTVAIEVETYSNGTITLPASVVATLAECDYATLTYDGGDTATVTFTSENTTSDAREATVTFTYGDTSVPVTVQQGVNPANKIGYELVTDASKLAVGDEVIIVAKNATKALACPTKTSDTKFPSADIAKTGNVIYDIEDAGVQTFKLVEGNSEGTMAFEFSYKDTTYYPYYSSGLKMRTGINDQASWTITIVDGGEATISTVSSSSTYLIKFNSATSSLTFTCYKDSAANATKEANAVCIYKKQIK